MLDKTDEKSRRRQRMRNKYAKELERDKYRQRIKPNKKEVYKRKQVSYDFDVVSNGSDTTKDYD